MAVRRYFEALLRRQFFSVFILFFIETRIPGAYNHPTMSTQLILNLPDDTYERVAQFAAYAKRDVSEVIAAALASSLPSLDAIAQLRNITKLSDSEILQLTELRLAPEIDLHLSELLDRKQAGELTELEQAELAALMRMYEMGLLRQSQALAEAVKRGLIPPLQP